MGKIILPHMSLPVYLRWPFGGNVALKVIFLSKMLRAMQHRLLSPSSHSKKPTKAKRDRKNFISVAGFCAFFCFDRWGDILMLVPTNCCDVKQPNFVGQACMALNAF